MHAGRHITERNRATRAPQSGQISLRKCLIVPLQVLGKRYVLDAAAAVPRQHRIRHIVKGLGAPGADIVNAARTTVLSKPSNDGGDVGDVYEIATLLTGPVPMRAFEKSHRARLLHLIAQVPGNTRHATLVALAGAVDIEIAQTDNRRVQCR